MRKDQVRPTPTDAGISLIETVVAAVILAIVASVAAALMIRTLDVANDNTRRTTAANIAASQIEAVREMRTVDIPDGLTQLSPVSISGTTYTVSQDAALVSLNAAATSSACSTGAGGFAYKRVVVTVTWPNMGSTQPVRSDTLRAFGFGADGLDASRGAAGVTVQDSEGVGIPNMPVKIVSSVGSTSFGPLKTGADGCVVFTNVPVGNYSANISVPGYVDIDGNSVEVTDPPFGVSAGQLSTPIVPYARLGQLQASLTAPPEYEVPSLVGLSLQTSKWAGTGKRAYVDCSFVTTDPQGCVTGTNGTRLAGSLFPSKYRAWAGTCADAEPLPATELIDVDAGGLTSVSAGMGLVDVSPSALPLTVNKPFYAVHTADAQCPGGAVYSLGNLPALLSVKKVALPYGTWYIQTTNSPSLVRAGQKVTLSPPIAPLTTPIPKTVTVSQ